MPKTFDNLYEKNECTEDTAQLKHEEIKANKKHNDQINEKIAFYRQTKSENIWQEIYLKARMVALKRNIPGGSLDKISTLKDDIERLYIEIIETGNLIINF